MRLLISNSCVLSVPAFLFGFFSPLSFSLLLAANEGRTNGALQLGDKKIKNSMDGLTS